MSPLIPDSATRHANARANKAPTAPHGHAMPPESGDPALRGQLPGSWLPKPADCLLSLLFSARFLALCAPFGLPQLLIAPFARREQCLTGTAMRRIPEKLRAARFVGPVSLGLKSHPDKPSVCSGRRLVNARNTAPLSALGRCRILWASEGHRRTSLVLIKGGSVPRRTRSLPERARSSPTFPKSSRLLGTPGSWTVCKVPSPRQARIRTTPGPGPSEPRARWRCRSESKPCRQRGWRRIHRETMRPADRPDSDRHGSESRFMTWGTHWDPLDTRSVRTTSFHRPTIRIWVTPGSAKEIGNTTSRSTYASVHVS